jgi:hypothetical protein
MRDWTSQAIGIIESSSGSTAVSEAYFDSYYDDAWLKQKGFDLSPYRTQLDNFYASGKF